MGLANGDRPSSLDSANLYASLGVHKGLLPSEFNIQSEEFPALPGATGREAESRQNEQLSSTNPTQASPHYTCCCNVIGSEKNGICGVVKLACFSIHLCFGICKWHHFQKDHMLSLDMYALLERLAFLVRNLSGREYCQYCNLADEQAVFIFRWGI